MQTTRERLFIFFLILIFIVGIFGIVFEVLNPHSALAAAGAWVRVGVLSVAAFGWGLFSRWAQRRVFNFGMVFLLVLIGLYLFAGVQSACQEFAYRYDVVAESYRCPMMLFN